MFYLEYHDRGMVVHVHQSGMDQLGWSLPDYRSMEDQSNYYLLRGQYHRRNYRVWRWVSRGEHL